MTAPQAPGTRVFAQTQLPASNATPSTGSWFVAGPTQRGPVGKPIVLRSMADYATYCGLRTPSTAMFYDALELFFRDGGSQAILSRRAGPAVAAAALLLKDQGSSGGANTLQVSANSPGAWGSNLTVTVTVSGSTYQLAIGYNGAVVETSPTLTSPADAVAWSSASRYVKITDQGSAATAPANNPAALAASSLTGGVDDNGNIVDTTMAADLAVLTSDYGPGQVSVPGATTDLAHQVILAHAASHNRVALLDALDTPVAATLVTAAGNAVLTQTDPTAAAHGGLFAPWIQIPGIPTSGSLPSAVRVVPPSALAAAGCARVDGGGNPNVMPAGAAGVSNFAIGVTQAFSDTDRASLNTAGVNVTRYFNSTDTVELYGFRTLSTDPLHTQMNWARLDMAITHDATQIGESHAFGGQIDSRGHVFSAFQGALQGMLAGYFNAGALYGILPTEAYKIDVGADVNTTATIAAGQINATIALKRSAAGEFVNIGIVCAPLATVL